MGIGFAIPSNSVKDIATKLVRDGKIVRGWLGVYIQPLEPDMARELGVKSGVGIHEVVQKGPAAAAGLRAGDIILEVGGTPVKDINELQEKISGLKPGQVIKMKVMSYANKRTRAVTVTIGELPAEGAEKTKKESGGQADQLGLAVAPAPKGKGVVVQSVQPESTAEQVGIEPGDIIRVINRKPIDSVEAYRKALAGAKWISLELERQGQALFLQFSLGE
jgi:serine protease Do